MYRDFPFTIVDVAYLLNLHVRHKNTASLDVDCPFCGEKKGKLNLNTKRTCSSATGAGKAAACSPCMGGYTGWITRLLMRR